MDEDHLSAALRHVALHMPRITVRRGRPGAQSACRQTAAGRKPLRSAAFGTDAKHSG
jgi:hypothetical protein